MIEIVASIYFGVMIAFIFPVFIVMDESEFTKLQVASVMILWPIAVPLILFVQLREVLRSMIP